MAEETCAPPQSPYAMEKVIIVVDVLANIQRKKRVSVVAKVEMQRALMDPMRSRMKPMNILPMAADPFIRPTMSVAVDCSTPCWIAYAIRVMKIRIGSSYIPLRLQKKTYER